jgi:uncharacterized protein (TIGR00730 family)
VSAAPRRFGSVAVFCASSRGTDPRYADAAARVGRGLAALDIGIVYGGGRVGLMGVLADATLEAGGRVVGVIPRRMVEAERGHTGLTELIVVESMHERKAIMTDRADAFLALPGGYGTLDELFEAITWAQLGLHAKPIGLLDVAGFYAPLTEFLDSAVVAGFIQPAFRGLVQADDDLSRLLERMAAAQRPDGAGWARPGTA